MNRRGVHRGADSHINFPLAFSSSSLLCALAGKYMVLSSLEPFQSSMAQIGLLPIIFLLLPA